MADNERNDPGAPPTSHGMTTPPAGNPVAPPPGEPGPPPAMRPPTEVTPDQVRQFQEFQRFQELMRQQAEKGLPPATPPPGLLQPWGQPPKRSLPKRLLKAALGKIITGLVFLALLIGAGYFAIDYFLGPDVDQPTASQTGGGKTKDNLILPTNPYEAVRMVYHDIANDDGVPEHACERFKDGGKQFAANMGYRTCEEAINGLNTKVTSRDAYAESMPSNSSTFNTKNETEARISSCEDSRAGRIDGGPPLGVFTLEKIKGSEGGQWIITGHETEPPCATTSTAPSN